MKRIVPTLALSALALIATDFFAQAEPMDPAAAAAKPTALDRLKKLEGEWTGQATHGTETMPVTVTYHVTSAGSAVMETQFQGTPHEMITMYTLERGQLVLTHYCAVGNQPRMKARADSGDGRLVFEFAGGAGIDPKKDVHMHAATFSFPDEDHLRAEWTSWAQGKPTETAVFELTRKK